MYLASAKIYITIAITMEMGENGVLSGKGMSLWETNRRDVIWLRVLGSGDVEKGEEM
jgi:hypothetical protein